MKSAIILHGMPSKEEYLDPKSLPQSKQYWLRWLKKELQAHGFSVEAPDLPEPYEPVYEKWRSVFETLKVDQDTLLVGHSCGAGFLVRWLSENKTSVGKVILVAPFLDPDHDEIKSDFFDFVIDKNVVARTKGLHILYSIEDEQEILESVEQLRGVWPDAQFKEFTNKGHFTFKDMKTEEFPELREIVLE